MKFEDTKDVSVEEFTPKDITRTNCTSVTARIYDTQGLLAPLTLKLKNDLRTLISYEPSWTKTIPDHQRAIWVNNFKTIEEVRDIPTSDARSHQMLSPVRPGYSFCVMLPTQVSS